MCGHRAGVAVVARAAVLLLLLSSSQDEQERRRGKLLHGLRDGRLLERGENAPGIRKGRRRCVDDQEEEEEEEVGPGTRGR